MTNQEKNSAYIDGFAFPIHRDHLNEYNSVAQKVAEIWKEHGATQYLEFAGDELNVEGTRSFTETIEINEGETVVFGWAIFPSKDVRDSANQKVRKDPRMGQLVAPLMDPASMIFNPGRMAYGGFKSLVKA